MATLSLPTGAEIVSIFTMEAGSVPAIGSYNEDAIDAEILALGSSSVPNLELVRMNAELDASGLNSSNLSTAEFNAAWIALLWACAYQYRVKDRIRRLANGEKCEDESMFKSGLTAIATTICNYLYGIGARNKYYCGFYADAVVTSTRTGDLVDYFPPNNFNSTYEA